MSVSTLKNAFGRTRLLAVLCSLMFVFVVACGDDDESNNGTTNNGGTNNGGVDAGDTGGGTGGDAGGEDTGTDTGGGTGGDTGNGDTGGTSGCQPLDPPPADQAQCSVLCQTGCADGEACIRGQDQSGNTLLACQPAGPGQQGDTCSQTAACAAGFGCLVTSAGDTEGTCHAFCRLNSPDEPQCADGARCLGLQGAEGLGACFSQDNACEVFPNDDCTEATQTCSPSPTGNECVTFDDTASAGDSCSAGTDCNDAQACANITGSPQCYDLCDQSNPQCAEGTQCAGITFGQGEEPAFFACVAQ